MDSKEKLGVLRTDIDNLDRQLVALFNERMQISEQIAAVKAQGNMAVVDRNREQQVLERATNGLQPAEKADVMAFMRTMMALSKSRQNHQLMLADPVYFPPSMPIEKKEIKVAFQGVSGAWGEQAASQLFPGTQLENLDYFDDVFEAVKKGVVDFGVLPIENSQTGAIGEVYDLLRRNACFIVGEIWISIAQCLLAKKGTSLSDIREVYSHPEGFNQCRQFLKNRSWDLTVCRNTAYAAQLVSQSSDARCAAIGARRAADVHGLVVLQPDIMDNTGNRTRFISIAANPIYNADSVTTSITFSTPHSSGALCAVLQSFMVSGINLTRIESRPVTSDKYRFFADLQCNIMSADTLEALRLASMQCEYFEVLGCYPTHTEKK